MERWTRMLLVALVVAYIPGTPGLGVDTRDQTAAPALLGYVYGAAFRAPLAVAIILPGLDLTGVLAGPPPAGMIVLNVILVALGAAIVLRQRNAEANVAGQGRSLS